MMRSNYPGTRRDVGDRTVAMEDIVPDEVPCKRCHGLGEDREGADCVFCDGLGSTYLR